MIHIACTEEVNTISNKNTSTELQKDQGMSTMQKVFIGLSIAAAAAGGYFVAKYTITSAYNGDDYVKKMEQQILQLLPKELPKELVKNYKNNN